MPETTTLGHPLLQLVDVTKQYPLGSGLTGARRAVHAVDGVNLEIRRGEVLSLVGESGSGKSTLGRCITGMTPPTSGHIAFEGQDIGGLGRSARAAFRRRVQPVFQDPRSSLDPRWPVARTIREPLDANRIGSKATRTERVRELMNLVGLPPHLIDRMPGQLSGGQQQRVAIAAALALEPDLLVADEPVSALDVSVQAQILNLLGRLRDQLGLALLFIAHDLSVVEHLSDRVAVMYLGRIVEVGEKSVVFDNPQHPYTRALIDSIPYPDPTRRMVRSRLRGEIPSPIDPPSGCHFHTRCPLVIDHCRDDAPPLVPAGPARVAACWVTTGADGSTPTATTAATATTSSSTTATTKGAP
jgi:oligopeptide/dipeptide ABC transporter ATP-binding protein